MLELKTDVPPEPRYRFQREYSDGPVPTCAPNGNFLKGVKWSPDGLCFLTASDDNWFRIYDTPPEAFAAPLAEPAAAAAASGGDGGEGGGTASAPPALQQQAAASAAEAGAAPAAACLGWPQQQHDQGQPVADHGSVGGMGSSDSFAPALRIEEGELVYDYAWFPRMLASDPASCCFASSSRAHPVHLWDACTGELRCTYRAYDSADEVTAAYSLAFDPDGGRLYCGFSRAIRTFDVARPGRDYSTITTYQKKQEGQPGIISSLALNPDRSGMLAAGAYSGVAALYDTAARGALVALLEGHSGGVTQVQFSACGNYLYTGARRDPGLYCWDVRYNSGVLYTMWRQTPTTNQRIQFDIEPCGRHLATGGEDGVVRVFDLRDGSEVGAFQAADDTVNGCHFHPYLPLLATASGHRRFFLAPDTSSDEEDISQSGGSSSMSEDALQLLPAGGDAAGTSVAAAVDDVAGRQGTAAQARALESAVEEGERGRDGGGTDEAAACSQGGSQLGPLENVLRVWRFQAVEVPDAAGIVQQQGEGEAEDLAAQVEEEQLE